MELKVGDKVRVKNNLIAGKVYGKYRFIDKMMEYKNKVSKIVEIEENCITIDLDNRRWCWSEEMLEKVKDEKEMSKFKVYEMPDYVGNEVKKVIVNEPCVIVILNSGEKGIAKCCAEDEFNEERGYIIALERARKEKYLNDVVKQDEIIKQCLKTFDEIDIYRKIQPEYAPF